MFQESLMASPQESEGTQLTRYKDKDGYEVSKNKTKICWSSQLVIKVIVLTSAFEDGWSSPWWLWLVLGHCQNIYKGKPLMLTAFFNY